MLERGDVKIVEERPARKEPLTDADVRKLLKRAGKVVIARGKKRETHAAGDVRPDQLRGPSGNYRAPMLLRGKSLLVGFSADTLEEWFG